MAVNIFLNIIFIVNILICYICNLNSNHYNAINKVLYFLYARLDLLLYFIRGNLFQIMLNSFFINNSAYKKNLQKYIKMLFTKLIY